MSKPILLFFLLFTIAAKAQVVINEASNRNYSQVADENNEFNDWIELYNTSDSAVLLKDWFLSDSRKNPKKWHFGDVTIDANGFVLVNASGNDLAVNNGAEFWSSAVLPSDTFKYIVPAEEIKDWNQISFNDSLWNKGIAGFGYGDNDDSTLVPNGSVCIYIRKVFEMPDTSDVKAAILHVDYDDGFSAYLNGVEIARANIEVNAGWNSTANGNHEANMYTGGLPEQFNINPDLLKSALVQGENVLAIEAHNIDYSSTDFSMIPFLSFGFSVHNTYFHTAPEWLYTPPGDVIHTNFKLSGSGEKIFLSDKNGVVDSLDVDHLQVNQSIGRTTDGASTYGIFLEATPGETNNASQAYTQGTAHKPDFSLEAGFYDGMIEVSMTAEEDNAVIRFTKDGSEPTENSGIYNSSIRIVANTILRARVFVPGMVPSEIRTATYIINDEFELPVLSVSTNTSNLYGDKGIFSNWSETFDVPVYAEYFDKNKKLAFKTNAGMQVDGGAGGSRSQEQHSFRIEPGNSTLGDGDIKYKLLSRRPNRTNYPSFYMRNGSNMYNALPYKDAAQVTALGRNTYTYYSAYEPAAVFINGEFFGVYEIREKINDDYLVDNYRMKIDSLDFLGVSYFKGQKLEALRGSIDPYLDDLNRFQQMTINDEDFLEDVGEFLDLENYTDYIIAESWVGNSDWPFNNIKVFRCESTDFKWRWAINDLELSLNPNGWTTSSYDHISYLLQQGEYSTYTGFWYKMMQTNEYKAYFINRFADLMNTNYKYSVIGKLEMEMYDELYPEMDRQFSRWGGGNVTSRLNAFTRNHETFRSELSKRSGFVRTHLQNHYNLKNQVELTLDVEPEGAGAIQINTITPALYPWEGIYFTNVPVTVTAVANLGYEFAYWEKVPFIEDEYSAENTNEFTQTNVTLKAHFMPVDSHDAGMVISEINYKKGTEFSSPDWIELCNLSVDAIDLTDWYLSDEDSTHRFTFSGKYFVEPGQRLVLTNNIDQFKAAYPGVNPANDIFGFGLGGDNDEIKLFNANDELVFSVHYFDEYPWALSANEEGRTLELRTAQTDYSQSAAWFRGCIGGSPGTAYEPCDEVEVSVPQLARANNLDIDVYPNPATDLINIDLKLEREVNQCDVKIYNLLGSELYSKSFNVEDQNWFNTTIDISTINERIMILKVTTNLSERTTKVMKVK